MLFRLPKLPDLGRDVHLLNAVLGMFAVSFFGIQMLIKVLYILRLGYGLEFVGLFSSISAFSYMAMSVPSGLMGGRFGPRKTMISGGALTVVGMAMLPLTEFVSPAMRDGWAIVSQFVGTGGWAFFSVNIVPTLMASSTPQSRSRTFAWNSLFRGLGGFVGTLVGGLLPGLFAGLLDQSLDGPVPYRYALWVGVALGTLSMIPLSQIRPVQRLQAAEAEADQGGFPFLPVAWVVVFVLFSHGGRATCQAFCNPFMDTDLHLSPASIGFITGLGQFVAVLVPLLSPGLVERFSNGRILLLANLGAAISLIPLVLLPHWITVALGRLGILALSALWLPVLQVFQMELVGSRWRSLAYSIVSMAMALSFGSISLAGGYIAATWGYQRLFLLGAGLYLLGAMLMWGLLKLPFMRPATPPADGQPAVAGGRSSVER